MTVEVINMSLLARGELGLCLGGVTGYPLADVSVNPTERRMNHGDETR